MDYDRIGPRGVIIVNGNMERSLRTEEHTAALAAEVYNNLLKPNNLLANKAVYTHKQGRFVHSSDQSTYPDLD